MDSIKKKGILRNDPTITKNGHMTLATFSFYEYADSAEPPKMVYVAAFNGIADFAAAALRKGYAVAVTGRQNPETGTKRNNSHQACINMVADMIEIIGRPKDATDIPKPLEKSKGALCREEYEARGGFSKPEPVSQSWEEGETVEDFHE